jgi:hypothetical protein
LDKEINTKESISPLGFRLSRFSKEEVSCVEEKDFSPLFFYLGDKSRFLGDTTKRAPESPTGLGLTHYIIGVDDTELDFGCSTGKRNVELGHDEPDHDEHKGSSIFQFNPPFYRKSSFRA